MVFAYGLVCDNTHKFGNCILHNGRRKQYHHKYDAAVLERKAQCRIDGWRFERMLLRRKHDKRLWIRIDRGHGWLEFGFLAFIQPLRDSGRHQCLLWCNKHC